MSAGKWVWVLTAALLMVSAVGCGDDGDVADNAGDEANNDSPNNDNPNNDDPNNDGPNNDGPNNDTDADVTYHGQIAPMVAEHCGECHVEGGVGPFVLDSYDGLKMMGQASLASIRSGSMPPWQPSADCQDYEGARLMGDDEIAAFERWVELGMPAGEPDQSAEPPPPPEPEETFDPTHTGIVSEPYLPKGDNPDDYRCFILDLDFEDDMFMTASNVIPDAGALVHHVLVYAIEPEQLELIEEADAAEPGLGYTCFGAPFPSEGDLADQASQGLPIQVGSWVPGGKPQIFPDDVSVRIRKGSKIVMQVHYNLLGNEPEGDATDFQMQRTDQPTARLASTRPLIVYSLDIPAGEPEAVNTRTYRNFSGKTLKIASVAAHMHLLGKRYKAHINHEGGEEECLLEIPDWDFNWQENYSFVGGKTIDVAPGESITLECVYDNSAANQPVVNGEQIEPRNVSWGDGTLDEMCMVYMTFIEDYEPLPEDAGSCAPATGCFEACEADQTNPLDCMLSCDMPNTCKVCSLRSIIPCAARDCLTPFLEVQNSGCLEDCFINTMMLGGDTTACFRSECEPSYDALATCLEPIINAGSCDQGLADTCGIVR